MPVAAIPFRSPAPFDLPPHVLDGLREATAEAAADMTLDLLDQLDAADWQFAVLGASGALRRGPVRAADAAATAALEQGVDQLVASGRADDLVRKALAQPGALLVMGDVEAGAVSVFPPAIADLLLAGGAQAPVGFVYVLPLMAGEQAHGVLVLHRSLAAGPLNHDQPAIARALTDELAARVAATPTHP